MKCPNCNIEIEDRFCPKCGIENTGEKTTTEVILKDFVGSVFSLEKSFFNQFQILLRNPTRITKSYWQGFRRYYFSPARWFVISSFTLAISLTITKGTFFGISIFLTDNLNLNISSNLLIFLLFMPFIMISTWLTFIKKKDFSEIAVMTIYNSSLWVIIFSFISIPAYFLMKYDHLPIFFKLLIPIMIFLIMYWNVRVFKFSKLKSIIYFLLNSGIFMGIIFITYLTFKLLEIINILG